MVEIVRLRRSQTEWGDYSLPLQERRYTIRSSGSDQDFTLAEVDALLKKRGHGTVDYAIFDKTGARWIRGVELNGNGKKKGSAQSISRLFNENFERVRVAEGLKSKRETMDFLRREYESFPPGYPGGYSQLRLDFSARLAELRESVLSGHARPTDFMRRGYPNNYLAENGVKDVVGLRRSFGEFAARKLAPVDAAYANEMRAVLVEQGRSLGKEEQAKDLATDVIMHLMEMCPYFGPMDATLEQVYEKAYLMGEGEGLAEEERKFAREIDALKRRR